MDEHPLVQQDAGTYAILILVGYALFVNMITSASTNYSLHLMLLGFGILYQFSTDFQNWVNTDYKETFDLIIRNAKMGTWVIRRIILSSTGSYDLWSTENISTMIYVYWVFYWPYAILGTVIMAIPGISQITSITSQLIVIFLYPSYGDQLWSLEGTIWTS